jgi:dienelactone hydrolase
MPGQDLSYDAAGLTMIGELHRPSGSGSRPAVLVFPEAFGFSPHAQKVASRLADELGYVALACDLWGERKRVTDLAEVMPMLGALNADIPALRARVQTPLQALKAQDGVDANRIAAIGFCFGGTMAFELSTCSPIKAAIGFHSGLKAPSLAADASKITAKVLAMIGADDPAIPEDTRGAFAQTLREAGVDWQLHLYGGVVHSFTEPAADAMGNPAVLRYDARADRRSWASMAVLLAEVFA